MHSFSFMRIYELDGLYWQIPSPVMMQTTNFAIVGEGNSQKVPPVDIDEVLGICEILHEYNGRVDLYDLAREFGYVRLLPLAIDAAKSLSLVKVSSGDVSLTATGRIWAEGDADERQRLIRDQMVGLTLIRSICAVVRDSSGALRPPLCH